MSAIDVRVPDIGDFHDIPVIELLVTPGQRIEKDAPLVTLESDKATMEVPSPQAGTVRAIAVKVGDKVSEGSALLTLDGDESAADAKATARDSTERPSGAAAMVPDAHRTAPDAQKAADANPVAASARAPTSNAAAANGSKPGAAPRDSSTPSAAEDGVARDFVKGLGATLRNHAGPESHPIARPDRGDAAPKPHASPVVRKYARELGVNLGQVTGSGPKERIVVEDVQEFVRAALGGGAAGAGIHASPAGNVVRHEREVDVTSLEAFRDALARNDKSQGELPLLAFAIKAVALALAGSTDTKGVAEIAREIASAETNGMPVSVPAAEGASVRMRGVERLDAAVTPAALASWLAVIDVATTVVRPVWDGAAFAPRSMLPIAIWSDRHVLDDAAAAALLSRLAAMLADLRRAIL